MVASNILVYITKFKRKCICVRIQICSIEDNNPNLFTQRI